MKYLITTMIAFAFGINAGCEHSHSTKSNSLESSEVKKIEQPIIGFNWSRSLDNLQGYLTNSIRSAREGNNKIRTKDDIPLSGLLGYGLYIASDPLDRATSFL